MYDLKVPFTNRDAIENINQIQNILASFETASLIEQITGQDFQVMTIKCILNRRIDLYTDSWTKYAKAQEGERPEEDNGISMGAALKNLSVSVTALKQTSLTVNQIHFFITYLEDEIKQLNFLESRGNNDNRQTGARGRYQGNQGERQFRPRYQNFNLIEQRGPNQQQQNIGYPQQQQGVQNLQEGNSLFQSGNQQNLQQNQQQGFQRKVQISFFPCPLGCGHLVPCGFLAGCENFTNMTPRFCG